MAAHGSAPDIANKNIANPIGEIASAAMLFGWLGDQRENNDLIAAGASIDSALNSVLESGLRPRDMGGTADTTVFTEALVHSIDKAPRTQLRPISPRGDDHSHAGGQVLGGRQE
jgi:3-isopropylmalate dehydrogenase